jgi:hypothetical protein
MNIMTRNEFRSLIKKLPITPEQIHIPNTMANGTEECFGNLVYLTVGLGLNTLQEYGAEKLHESPVHAFMVDKEMSLVDINPVNNHRELREAIHEHEEDSIGYIIMLASRQIRGGPGSGCSLSRKEITELLDGLEEDEVDEVCTAKGIPCKWGLTTILSTRHSLNAVAVMQEDAVELIALSDWDGELPLVTDTMTAKGAVFEGIEMFTGLFKKTFLLDKSDWASCVDKDAPKELNTSTIDQLVSDPDAMTKLLEADGHDGFKAAYAALIKLAVDGKALEDISVRERKAILAALTNRANRIQTSLDMEELATHATPERVQ